VTGRDGKSPVWAKDADMAAESSSTTPAVMGNLRLSIYLSPANFDVVVSSKVHLIAPDYKSNELKDCSIFYMHLFFLKPIKFYLSDCSGGTVFSFSKQSFRLFDLLHLAAFDKIFTVV
jgi:hypothetical protein